MKKHKKTVFTIALLCYVPLTVAEEPSSADRGKFSLFNEHHYYSWKDDKGNKGYQYATPVTLSYQNGGFNAGLRRAFIVSENQSPDSEGRVSHWSDTSLSLAYTTKHFASTPIRFNLSMNLPNGKSTLSGAEKNAIMDGHLVWQTRFGEGFNITPGINVSHALSDKDVVGLGVSKIFRGEFDPNSDVDNDTINPGNDTIATLNYSHNEQKWFVNTGLTYQHSDTTKRGGKDYYQKGGLWSFDLGGAVAFNDKHSLRTNYHYAYRQKDEYINNLTGNLQEETFNSNGATHFINMDYGYRFNDKHSLHFVADYLRVKSNDYDQINYLYVPARKKWSIGVRYDWVIDKNLSLSTVAKRFKVTDNPTPIEPDGKDYKGWNISANLQYQF